MTTTPIAAAPAVHTVHGACPHDCPDTCALRISVQDGRAVRVEGRADHASTNGALCTKVSRYTERTYHAERVLYPLRRTGPKGSGRYERVGWDEALTDIAARLQAIARKDAQGILPYSYAGTMGLLQRDSMSARFFHRLGASRLERTICSSAGNAGLAEVYGAKVGMHQRFFAESRLILIWGSNSIASNLHFWTIAQQAKRDGARLVCIDPRRTATAEKCHDHIQLLPGTDGALALALMHELIVHELLDHDYIARHVQGWEALRQRALQWPPERAAEVCGITAQAICDLAQAWGSTERAAIRVNYGMQRTRGGGNAMRLIALLPCLTGAWRHRAGGCMLTSSGWSAPYKDDAALTRPDLLAGRTPRRINMSTIGDDLLRQQAEGFGPRIDAVVVYNSNPVAVAPDSSKVAAGFAREDLFTVVLEHFMTDMTDMTDMADLADYVLPATTQLEHLDVHTSYGHTDILLNTPAVAPLGEALPNTEIFRRLARHMGFADSCFADDDATLVRQALTPQVDLQQLSTHGIWSPPLEDAPFAHGGFPTPSGRALAIDAQGEPPDFIAPYESRLSAPALAERFPLAMISPPARNFLNSTFVNVDSLRRQEHEPHLEMCPQDAAQRQIADGALVRVWNARGSHVCRASVGDRARPGLVVGLGLWWRKLGVNGTNVNEVTHQRLTDLGNGPCFYDVLVQVEACAEQPPGAA